MFANRLMLSIKRTIHQLITLAALLSLPLIFYWRVNLVDSTIGARYGLDGIYSAAVMKADGPLLALVGLLLLGSWFIRSGPVGIALRVVALIILLLYIVDLIVFKQFGIRVLFSSIQLYGSQGEAIWEQLQKFLGGKWKAIAKLVILGVFLTALLLPPRKPWVISILACLALTLFATVIALMPWKMNYVNSWVIQNYLDANLFVSQTRTYSEPYIKKLMEQAPRPVQCQAGLHQRKNVIIMIIESLSAFQSRAYGGVNDWTPELDTVSTEGVVFRKMHANGFATNEGLIGILGGVRLYSPFSHLFRAVVPFETAWGLEHSLPREFNEAGYHTAFLTLGSLGITRKGEWIKDLGFQEAEGSEHPFYEDWPTVQYRAAADEALYARSLNWIESRQPGQPWMLTLMTISMHQPFIDPMTNKSDLEQVVRYADRQAATFIRNLQKSDFFDNGILLVIGDHRSMTPISKEEERIFGTAAASRVQFLMFGQGETGVRDGVFHHSDLVPSFSHWLNDEHCFEDEAVNLFSPKSRGRCAHHVRGSQPSLVDVFCPDGQGLIQLNGDSTQFIQNDGIVEEEQSAVLQLIARERLAGQQRHLRYLENLKLNAADIPQ